MWSSIIHPDRRHALHKLDKRWLIRLKLRLASLTCALLSLIAFLTAIPTWSHSFFHASGPLRGDWSDGLVISPLTLSLVVDLCTIHSTLRRCHPPDPERMTIVETILLLLLTPALVLAVAGSLFIHFSAAVPQNDGAIDCAALHNFLSRACSPALYSVGALQLLGVVFGCVVWIVHVSLALWGAVDVRRNRRRRTAESALERRRRRWREQQNRSERGRTRQRAFEEPGTRTGTDAYETYGWYR